MDESLEPADLTRESCLRLLGAGGLGRIVFTSAAMPALQPVSFDLVGDEVTFLVPPGSPVAAAIRGAVVGFQVDEIDATTGIGWTVLGVGKVHEIAAGPGRPRDGLALAFVVRLHELSGRRVHLRPAAPTRGLAQPPRARG